MERTFAGIARSQDDKRFELWQHTYRGEAGNMKRADSVLIATYAKEKDAIVDMRRRNGLA